ncbi:MAG TPA: helix-turn-helix transcriptional regulator [Micromonosporaceae bacterium]
MDERSELDTIDAAICLVLQNRPNATAPELSPVVPEASDDEITESLRRLHTDGLVKVIEDSPLRYAAKVSPEQVAAVLARRHRHRAITRYRTAPPFAPWDGGPGVLTGPAEIRRMVDGIQRTVRREVLCVDKPPYAGGPVNPVEPERLAGGVRYRVVYDRSALAVPGYLELVSELVELGEHACVASGVPMKMMIFDRVAAVVPLQVRRDVLERALLVRDPALVGGLVRIFMGLWRSAVPFGPGDVPSGESALDGPTVEERQILALLAAGATDDVIGRQMNFSPRTAHRRVRDLTAKLGVETRFQAGVQAVRLGWL